LPSGNDKDETSRTFGPLRRSSMAPRWRERQREIAMAEGKTLRPAAELAEKASKPFPNDSKDYRAARTALLAEEIELRRHIERVAAQRRALPPGGEIAQDYEFVGEDGGRTKLSEMFGERDTLVSYFWMFGPQRARPCPMCTSFLGALDTPSRDIMQHVAVAIIGRSPIERQIAFKHERGWETCSSMPPSATIFRATIAASRPTEANGPRSTCSRRRAAKSAISGAPR
jgi:predicted dithiol-disulfide oxidoreductase (DUF899 family)